jgi:hypothetical protein
MDLSKLGPVEYAVIAFPGNRFRGEIVAELANLTERGIVHVIDLTFIKRDVDGSLTVLELDALDELEAQPFVSLDGEIEGLLSEEDIALIAEEVPPNSSAAIVVWEDSWAASLAQAVRRADGVLVAHENIPRSIVELSVAAAEAA